MVVSGYEYHRWLGCVHTGLDFVRLAARPARGFTRVGIGGRGGAGKSTLAACVQDAQIVSTDAFWDGDLAFTYDRDDRTYKLFWHDSLGYYSPAPASGGWSGNSLILVRGSLRGNARHVYEVVDNDNYTMKIQFSPDAEGWADVLTGVYRRIH